MKERLSQCLYWSWEYCKVFCWVVYGTCLLPASGSEWANPFSCKTFQQRSTRVRSVAALQHAVTHAEHSDCWKTSTLQPLNGWNQSTDTVTLMNFYVDTVVSIIINIQIDPPTYWSFTSHGAYMLSLCTCGFSSSTLVSFHKLKMFDYLATLIDPSCECEWLFASVCLCDGLGNC